jgi:hypothetical protein
MTWPFLSSTGFLPSKFQSTEGSQAVDLSAVISGTIIADVLPPIDVAAPASRQSSIFLRKIVGGNVDAGELELRPPGPPPPGGMERCSA